MPQTFWTMKDGTRIAISQMEDSHLRNASAFLRRTASENQNAYWRAGSMLQGEQANYAWGDAERSMEADHASKIAMADKMDAELKRRAELG